MAKENVPRISPETFPDAWARAAREYSRVRQCRLTEAFTDTLAHFLFLAEALFLSCGFLYSYLDISALRDILIGIPKLIPLWNQFRTGVLLRLPPPDFLPALAWELILACVLAWLLPVVLGLAITGLLRLLYHPLAIPAPVSDTDSEKAKQLLTLIRKIQYQHWKCGRSASTVCAGIYLLFVAFLSVFTLIDLPAEDLNALLTFAGPSTVTLLCCAFPAMYYLYALINAPVHFFLRRMYRCPLPETLVAETKEYIQKVLPKKEAAELLSVPVYNYGGFRRLRWLLIRRLASLPFVIRFLEMPMGFPCPLTEERLPEAWKWADKKQYWIKKNSMARKITSYFVHPYFAVMLCALCFGYFYGQQGSAVSAFLHNWPQVSVFWDKIRPVLYTGAAENQLTGRCLLLLYLIPIGFIAFVFLAVLLLYHPSSQKPAESLCPKEQALLLSQMLRQSDARVKAKPSGTAGLVHTLFVCLGVLLLLSFLLFSSSDPALSAIAQPQIGSILTGSLLFLLGLLLGYRLIRLPLDICLWLLTFGIVPPRALLETESFLEQPEQSETAAAKPTPTEPEEEACQNPTTKS